MLSHGATALALVTLLSGSPAKASEVSLPIVGLASIYSIDEKSFAKTASGEKLRDGDMSAAHRSLPFGTMVLVTNRKNGNSVVVRIVDRGPFVKGRVIDVTQGVATLLGFSGLTAVDLAVIGFQGASVVDGPFSF
jgi:rare lipoprotein A